MFPGRRKHLQRKMNQTGIKRFISSTAWGAKTVKKWPFLEVRTTFQEYYKLSHVWRLFFTYTGTSENTLMFSRRRTKESILNRSKFESENKESKLIVKQKVQKIFGNKAIAALMGESKITWWECDWSFWYQGYMLGKMKGVNLLIEVYVKECQQEFHLRHHWWEE